MNKTRGWGGWEVGGVTARRLTVSEQLQDGQVHMPLPERLLLYGDAVACGGEDVTAANGHQLAALVPARHVVEHGRVINESVKFANGKDRQTKRGAGDRLQLISTEESDITATTFQLTC